MRTIPGGLPVNDEQRDIIDHLAGHVLTVVSAGAGTGKTHLTVAAVLDLLAGGDAHLDQFILITFTNNAADKLRADLDKALADVATAATPEERRRWTAERERLSSAMLGTIHHFCRQVLRLFGYSERVARDADMQTAGTTLRAALEDVAEEYLARPEAPLVAAGLAWQEYELRAQLEKLLTGLRNRGRDPRWVQAETATQPPDSGQPYRQALADLIADVDRRYATAKMAQQQLDEADLLLRTAALLQHPDHGPDVVTHLSRRYRYLFIDEFQDTDRIQKQIVDALLGVLKVLVVGDSKQSIYGFRAGEPRLLRTLAEENAVPIHPLRQARRPTLPLLRVQNALFTSMGATYGFLNEPQTEPPMPRNPTSPIPPFIYLGTPGDRASRIAATARAIRRLLASELDDWAAQRLRPTKPGDIAVLLRSNRQIEEYEQGLRAALDGSDGGEAVEVRSAGGGLFLQPEIAAVYHMLRLLLHYPSDTALTLALRTPYLREVRAAAVETWNLQYAPQGRPLTDWFEHTYPHLHETLAGLRRALRTASVPELLLRLYDAEAFGIRTYYLARDNAQAEANLEKLRDMARALVNEEQALNIRQFTHWLEVALQTARSEPEARQPGAEVAAHPPYVRLLTIHAAKGLEFPLVVLPEVQRQVASSRQDPSFLVVSDWGLDGSLPLDGPGTASAHFAGHLAANRTERREEEMRLFYVAVTRAQQVVILIGQPFRTRPNTPDSEWYSWQDEVQRAWPQLSPLGAVRWV